MKRLENYRTWLWIAALATGLTMSAVNAQPVPTNSAAKPTITRETAPRAEPPPSEQRTYEDWFTFKWRTTFNYDPWVWGYTKEFAERFKMPEQWIEPELKGALAVAFRMSTLGTTTCGLSGREDNCWPPLDCRMDIYFDSSTPLPWKNPAIQQDSFFKGLHSGEYLDWPTVIKQTQEKYPRDSGSGVTGLDIGLDVYGPKGLSRAPGGMVAHYDKAFRPGVVLVSWRGPAFCPSPIGRAEITFRTWEIDKAIIYRKMKEENAPILHQVSIPESYIRRANGVYERENKPNQEVIQRLLRNFQESRQAR